ncbi:MAG: aminotransferase class I/II-fold pyridoxal phosphate-dependent enzyme [Clostridiales bacterium]|nr:aminotransferase class I/II-fold pyridoxal phosphate-dependent enzyme [Clostridiales bacterium]
MEFNTKLLHGNAVKNYADGATVPPISQTSAFSYETAEKLEKVFNNKAPGYAYTRIGNPTVDAFERRVCELEGGKGAVACASGMSAVTLSLLNILSAGDEIIAGSGLFGGTIDLFSDLKQFGITTRFVSKVTVEEIEPLINEHTKAVFGEVISNPSLDVIDIRSVADFVHSKGIPLIMDSTTATPYAVRPFEHGADIVVHSSSKYINGGGNSISGIIVDSGNFQWDVSRYNGFEKYKVYGSFAYLAKLRNGIWRNMGGCLSPTNAFLNLVGLETLGLRMERICSNSYELAQALGRLDGVSVHYPGLPDSPYKELVDRQLNGLGGGIITIQVGSKERAYQLLNSLKYALNATNIGDLRTLVIHPASTIYTHSTKEQKEAAGVQEDTIRISVGIEDVQDLIDDFTQAVESL